MELQSIRTTGIVTLNLYNAYGELIDQTITKNLVVTSGLNFIASRMAGASAAVMSHMAVGSSSTGALAANTDLGTIVGTRQALTVAGGTVSGATVTYACSFGTGVSTGGLQEAGVFNASTAGTMLCRTTFPIINKGANDTLVISWAITQSAAT
jgi:hypothetical protein